MATTPATTGPKSKLTCPSPTTGARGPRFHWRRGTTTRQARDPLRSIASRKLEEAQVVPLAFPCPTTPSTPTTTSTRKDDEPTAL